MKTTSNKFLLFLRKNAFYLILGFCILAIGLSITLVLLLKNNDNSLKNDDPGQVIKPVPDPDDNIPTDTTVVFIMPIESGSVLKDYTETVVFSSTLNRFCKHKAVDFLAEAGVNVLAVYGGTIESITTDPIKGTTVVVNHGKELFTKYNSIEQKEGLTVGQKVNKGDIIGQVANNNLEELKDGAHLHFEVWEKGKNINPIKYLTVEEK